LGWAAVILFIIGGLKKKPSTTIMFCMAGNLLFIAKYYLQGHYSPFSIMLCNTICALLIIVVAEKFRVYLGGISFIISAGFIISHYSSLYDLLTVAAAFCIVWSQVNLNSYIKYKIGVMASQFLWIVFSLSIFDYAMISTCLFIMASNAYSLLVNLDKDIADGKFVITPSTAPYLTRVINVAKVTQSSIETIRQQFNIISNKQKAPL